MSRLNDSDLRSSRLKSAIVGWFGGKVAFRFSLVAAVLSGLAILLVGGAYWIALIHQVEQQAAVARQSEAEAEAHRIGGILRSVTGAVSDLSHSSLLLTALTDSMGRDTYLIPFIEGMRRVQGIPLDLIFVDFKGTTLATNGAADLSNMERSWVVRTLATNQSRAGVLDGPKGQYLLIADMVIYDRTGSAEGALAYRLDFKDIQPTNPHLHLDVGSIEGSGGGGMALVSVDSPLSSLVFQVVSTQAPPEVIRTERQALLGFGLAAILAFAVVLMISRAAGIRLTRSLIALVEAADRVVSQGLSGVEVVVPGDDEVSRLGQSFNTMIAALKQSRDVLEATVEARTADLRNALLHVEASEERYRNLFTRSKAVMLLVDPVTGAVVDANRAAAEFYGYSVETLCSMQMRDINIQTAREIDQEMKAAVSEKRSHFLFRHACANGEIRDVEVHSGPVEVNGRNLLLSIVHDITVRRRLEEERERLMMAIHQSSNPIFITDAHTRIEYVNPAFFRVTGYSRDEAIGKRPGELLHSGNTDPMLYTSMWASLAEGQPWTGTFQNRRKDGSLYWQYEQITPIYSERRQLTHYLAVAEDVTERKKFETALLDANQQLEEQSADLKRMNGELEQFAYVASHDLRQPLRVISSYLTLIDRAIKTAAPPNVVEYMDFAKTAAKRMDNLIVALLEYSRTGRYAEPPAPVPLTDVLSDSLFFLEAARAESEAEITIEGDAPVVMGERIDLVRVFQNIIGNAIKYRSPERKPRICIAFARDGEFWQVSIQDNGTGMPEDQKDRVFRIFQRLVPKDQIEGTGIGLAVCKKIVELHGGRIWVETRHEIGSTFFLTLPAAI